MLYVAGSGRSGSTLLGSLLGSVPGMAHVGELRQVWQRGVLEDWRCGCGAAFSACPLWQPVLADAFPPDGRPDAAAALAAQAALLRVRHVPLVLASRLVPGLLRRRTARCAPFLVPLYRAAARHTGVTVVVDTSKTPSYAWMLGRLPGFDVRDVHLVRDPRGSAYSWGRLRARGDAGSARDMDRFGPLKAAGLWTLWNGLTELLLAGGRHRGRYLRLRYEDLVTEPAAGLRRVCALAGLPDPDLGFLDGTHAQLATSHTVSGNPSRMDTGPVRLVPDVAWLARMRGRDRRLVTAVTRVRLSRYGYPVRCPRQAA